MKKANNFKDLRMSGFVKWFHHLIMFITYPFRHFYIFFSVVLLACIFIIGIPLLHDVPFKQIPAWYQNLFTLQMPARVHRIMGTPKQIKPKRFKKDIKLTHAVLEPKPAATNKAITKEEPVIEQPTKYATWDIHKKPEHESIQKQVVVDTPEPVVDAVKSTEPEPVKPEPAETIKESTSSSFLKYRKLDNSELTYFQTPQRISGETIIYGPNELSVDDTFVYLYGIYTNPNLYDVTKARAYLRELVADSTVECYIVAQTSKGIATAICFADGKNINQSMVNAFLADNVAL
ncbi:MAG: hypothetical protein J5896_00685 [Alphaproteobacteria bacterium]|nr:hypothetical protein [Alphaproteobacteria bacterium]